MPKVEEIAEGVDGVGKILIEGGFGHPEVVKELVEGDAGGESWVW